MFCWHRFSTTEYSSYKLNWDIPNVSPLSRSKHSFCKEHKPILSHYRHIYLFIYLITHSEEEEEEDETKEVTSIWHLRAHPLLCCNWAVSPSLPPTPAPRMTVPPRPPRLILRGSRIRLKQRKRLRKALRKPLFMKQYVIGLQQLEK